LLSRVIGNALGITPKMLPVESGPDGADWFVGFEWTGRANHLSEWADGAASATRGANATSADAVVKFQHQGRTEILLIEWKYTERYGAPISPDPNGTRRKRYADKAFSPNGPIRSDCGLKLEDFFWEPFYQLLRQQMLAWSMEKEKEDGAERVRVLHISPAGNRALHKITSRALEAIGGTKHDDAFEAFAAVQEPAEDGVPRFLSRTTEQVFGPFLKEAQQEAAAEAWAGYLRDRYTFLTQP
jgi:hypothetical protein